MFIEDEGRTNNGFDNKGKYKDKLCMALFTCIIWLVDCYAEENFAGFEFFCQYKRLCMIAFQITYVALILKVDLALS